MTELPAALRDRLVHTLPGVVLVFELDPFRIVDAAGEQLAVFGYTAPELVAFGDRVLGALVHPDDLPGVQAELARLLHAQDDRAVEATYRQFTRGHGTRWFRARARVLERTPGGAPRLAVAHAEDVTEARAQARLLAESEARTRALAARLAERDKLDSLGTLAGGIAHDFNNMLAVVMGYLELLREEPGADFTRQAMEACLTATGRARDLVRQILTYTRRTPVSPTLTAVDVGAVVREALALLRATVPATVQLRVVVADDLPPVQGDAGQLTQVVLNLVANAEQAIRPLATGSIEVRVAAETLETPVERFGLRAEGRCVVLSVRDSGMGMTPETAARMCDPFFTTRALGDGTGMGLAVVHGILAAHRGALAVESMPGEGSTVRVHVPAAAPVADDATAPSGAPSRPLRVALCDDESELRAVIARGLRRQGHVVREYPNGTACLAALRDEPMAVDVVVTDQAMPGLAGDQLVEALRALRPELPVVLLTGFSHRLTDERLAALDGLTVLMKPVPMATLQAAVARAADRRV